ncbi:MAG: hypothetical protein QGH60_19805 [Phycisphaerae bacterium]|jgi:Spy/CpxP family protein refolding chaperone|nr:hypothetical protein [Phycisphaerae bacterium]
MKKLVTLTAILLVLSIASTMVIARDEASARDRKTRQRRPGAAKLEKLLESFNLSEEELARVKQIFDTRRQADANWKKENSEDFKDIRDAMVQAKKDGDSAAMKAAHERMKKLMASRKDAAQEVFVQLSEVLSKEQLAKVRGSMSPQRSGGGGHLLRGRVLNAALAKLDLTDVQEAEIKKIQDALNAETKKARAAMKEAKTREEKAEIMKALSQTTKEAWDKIKKILGEDLTAKLQQIAGEMAKNAQKRNDPFAGLNLTAEQREKITAIRQSVRQKMRDAEGPDAKRAVITEMRKEIDNVLSDQQKVQLKERMLKRRKARGQPKRRRDKVDR